MISSINNLSFPADCEGNLLKCQNVLGSGAKNVAYSEGRFGGVGIEEGIQVE